MPDKIRPYIQATAESLQVSVDMVATFVIAIISLCVQGKYKIQVKPDWEEPVNLYAVVVMRPSERKSPTLKMVSAPVFEYMEEENERRQPEISENETKKKILTGQITNISRKIAGSYKKKDSEYTMSDLLECQEELRKLEEEGLKELKLIVDDVTPEALVSTMKENDDRIGIVSAEGGIFGTMAGRYNDHTNIDIFLKGYSGEYYSTARIGRQGNTLKHPLITIVLAVQPQVICDIMDNKEFSGRGLLARFLYSMGLSDPQDVKDAKYIISRIEQNDKTDKTDKTIPKREVLRLCQRFSTAEEMEPGLQVLVEHGYIAIQRGKSGKRGGRPSEQIYINPAYYQWKEEQRK